MCKFSYKFNSCKKFTLSHYKCENNFCAFFAHEIFLQWNKRITVPVCEWKQKYLDKMPSVLKRNLYFTNITFLLFNHSRYYSCCDWSNDIFKVDNLTLYEILETWWKCLTGRVSSTVLFGRIWCLQSSQMKFKWLSIVGDGPAIYMCHLH